MHVVRRRNLFGGTSMADSFEEIRAGYDAARQTRFRRRQNDIPSSGAHADWHYRSESDFLKVMEWARGFARNNYLVGQIGRAHV